MNVIQHPNAALRRPLALFAHTLPELMEAEYVYDEDWLLHCHLNSMIGLNIARSIGLPIAHLVLSPEEKQFVGKTPAVPGLQVKRDEAVFSFTYPSIFTSDLLLEFIVENGHSQVVFFGFAANDVGLVSAINCAQRNLDGAVIRDCSPLFAIEGCSIEASDAAIFGTIEFFASVMNLIDFVESVAGKYAIDAKPASIVNSTLNPETLVYFLENLRNQAMKLGLPECAGYLERAVGLVGPNCLKKTENRT